MKDEPSAGRLPQSRCQYFAGPRQPGDTTEIEISNFRQLTIAQTEGLPRLCVLTIELQ